MNEWQAFLAQEAAQCGITLSQAQLDQFWAYMNLLLKANQVVNLTAITDPREVAVKHIIDSVHPAFTGLIPPNARVADIGSGAGLPGIPLAIVRPDLEITLVDSLQKRVRYLDETVAALGLAGVTTLWARAEDASRLPQHRERYICAVARAVAALPTLAEYLLPFVEPRGVMLALKSSDVEQEWKTAAPAIGLLGGGETGLEAYDLPLLMGKRTVVWAKKKKPTPAAYPRKAGKPERDPLG